MQRTLDKLSPKADAASCEAACPLTRIFSYGVTAHAKSVVMRPSLPCRISRSLLCFSMTEVGNVSCSTPVSSGAAGVLACLMLQRV